MESEEKGDIAMLDIVRRRDGGQLLGAPFGRLHDEMDALFNRFFGSEWPVEAFRSGAWWPAMDIAERENDVLVKAELPGMKADDIEISVQGNVLTISGEKKESTEDKRENYYHAERRYGSFRREVNLSSAVDVDKIKAEYHDGILTVTLPKTEQAKPKKISVKS
jgi:HSP20 family protein